MGKGSHYWRSLKIPLTVQSVPYQRGAVCASLKGKTDTLTWYNGITIVALHFPINLSLTHIPPSRIKLVNTNLSGLSSWGAKHFVSSPPAPLTIWAVSPNHHPSLLPARCCPTLLLDSSKGWEVHSSVAMMLRYQKHATGSNLII